jgi:hypothetical protein
MAMAAGRSSAMDGKSLEEMMQGKLIVMRLENMTYTHPKQDNSYFCHNCLKQVGIYPSGLRVILEQPDIEIICEICAAKRGELFGAKSAPGAIEEAIESYKRRKK